jgi:hypothetical protein
MNTLLTLRRSALLLLIFAVAAPTSVSARASQRNSSTDVSSYPRIQKWDDVASGYIGCFRVPSADGVLNYSGFGLTVSGPGRFFITQEAYRPALSGFVGAEIQEPATIAPSATVQGCPEATLVQQPAEIWEGKFTQLSDPSVVLRPGDVKLWGLLAVDNALLMVGGIWYDATNSQKRSMYVRSRNLAARGTVSNAIHVGTGTHMLTRKDGRVHLDEKPAYTHGYLGWVPQEWRAAFGADAAAGGTGKSITFRESQGPPLTFFKTADALARPANIPAQWLLNYPFEKREDGERMLGLWQGSALPAPTAYWPMYEPAPPGVEPFLPRYNPDGSIMLQPLYEADGVTPQRNADGSIRYRPLSSQYGALWNGVAHINSFAWPNKSRTIMFIASMGIGEFCYKDCPTHPVVPTTTRRDGTRILGGPHAEPNTYRVWFYDALDLLKVKRGEMKPWQVMPYRVENITLPGPQQGSINIRSAIVDHRTNRLYVAQYVDRWTEGGGYVDSPPVIHVYQLR